MRKRTLYGCAIVALIPLITVSVTAQDRINPFANPGFVLTTTTGGESIAPVEFILKAVMPSANNPLANINGKILKVGDDFFGYELISVSSSGAQLQRDTDIITLQLRPNRASIQQGDKS